jgi:hypothetical protein
MQERSWKWGVMLPPPGGRVLGATQYKLQAKERKKEKKGSKQILNC